MSDAVTTNAAVVCPDCPRSIALKFLHAALAAVIAAAQYLTLHPSACGPTWTSRIASGLHVTAVIITVALGTICALACTGPSNQFYGLQTSLPSIGTLKVGISHDELPPYADTTIPPPATQPKDK